MLLAAFAMLALLSGCTPAEGTRGAGTGYVEDVRLLADSRQIVISGWAAPEKASVFTTNLIVSLAGRESARGSRRSGAWRSPQ